MPFTISHVAAVLPFSRWLARWRILSAAVIGSMAPDFGYLMPNRPSRFETHSIVGLFTFCLPVGLLSYWFFQKIMKGPLLNLLPDQAYQRWRPFSEPAALTSIHQWLIAVLGVLAGAVTHLSWDAFTHEDARGVRMMPELADPMVRLHGHMVTGARILQDLSSLVGLVFVIAVLVYAWRDSGSQGSIPRELSVIERRSWVVAYIVASLGLYFGFLVLDPAHQGFHFIAISNAAIALLRGVALAIVLCSVLLYLYLRAKPRTRSA